MNLERKFISVKYRKVRALLFAHSFETKMGFVFGLASYLKTKPESDRRKHPSTVTSEYREMEKSGPSRTCSAANRSNTLVPLQVNTEKWRRADLHVRAQQQIGQVRLPGVTGNASAFIAVNNNVLPWHPLR